MRMDIISSQPIFHRCPVVMMLYEYKQSIIYIQINKKKKDYIILMKYIIRIIIWKCCPRQNQRQKNYIFINIIMIRRYNTL